MKYERIIDDCYRNDQDGMPLGDWQYYLHDIADQYEGNIKWLQTIGKMAKGNYCLTCEKQD